MWQFTYERVESTTTIPLGPWQRPIASLPARSIWTFWLEPIVTPERSHTTRTMTSPALPTT
jgi:hypothetical protein